MVALPIELTNALASSQGLTLFCCGNPARGDDGVGPWIAQQLQAAALPNLTIIEDFQWQIEHSLDFDSERVALFVDAAVNQVEPLRLTPVVPSASPGHSSHALTPAQLLSVCSHPGVPQPAAVWQLGVAASQFGLGVAMSAEVLRRGEMARSLIEQMVRQL